MTKQYLSRYALSLCLPLLINPAFAAVDAAQAGKLGAALTPVGAERAGNAAGTIPAWTGGLARDAGTSTDGFRADPFAGEVPLFTITAQNLEQYRG
ncbi:MAG: DUF1329 domain-containing protein, partial [Pseudomonas sp.]